MDGVLNNDGLKNNANDSNNESWIQLLKDLKIYEEMTEDDHLQFVRNEFVVGGSTWWAGGNGSTENYKEQLKYTDKEWEIM